MRLTEKQSAAIAEGARILEQQGYAAFLRFIARNKAIHAARYPIVEKS
jgi:hypothetical protein